MTRRVFFSLFFVALALWLATTLLVGGAIADYLATEEEKRLEREVTLAAEGIRHGGLAYLAALPGDHEMRYAAISADGSVLYDSHTDAATASNQATYPEMVAAYKTGRGTAVRASEADGTRLRYEARLLPDGSVLRLATPTRVIPVLFFAVLLPALAVLAIGIAVASRLAGRLTEHIVHPLNHPEEGHPFPELSPFYRRQEAERAERRMQEVELLRQRDEFFAVTRHMSEGILLVSANRTVLGLNPAAAALLDPIPHAVGERLTAGAFDGQLEELLIRAERGGPTEAPFSIGGEARRCRVTPIISETRTVGFVLLFFNISDRERAERMRREFTANVSHELKTPLHSIAGCAELLACGLVKSEDVPEFSRQIHTEAKRMIRLIEDILRLSQLDEGALGMSAAPLDLAATVTAVAEQLASAAAEGEVTLTTEGDAVPMIGIPHLVGEIVMNLASNAIKYNRPGGSVKLSAALTDKGALLTVADTGIGIPEQYRDRIFERFFRVDKSHSKAVGGTGLGLSIVKHAVALHGATLTLESEEGIGTTVTVCFPHRQPPKTPS